MSKLLAQVSPNKNKKLSSTQSKTQYSKEKIIETMIKFDFKITEQDKTFPIMYWLPKTHETAIGTRFKSLR